MNEFNILLVGDILSEKEIKIALNSFEEFYQGVTFKNQRKTKLTIVESQQNFDLLNEMINERNISAACTLISPENEAAVQNILRQSSIMFLPTVSNISKLIPIAFENGLPIVSISTNITRELLDNTCSRIVINASGTSVEYEFSETLRMLYFDPEAREILTKGSLARFNKEYRWGRSKSAPD